MRYRVLATRRARRDGRTTAERPLKPFRLQQISVGFEFVMELTAAGELVEQTGLSNPEPGAGFRSKKRFT